MNTPLQLEDLTLADLLPHRSPMMLINEILAVDSNHAVTRCVVDGSWPLVADGAAHPLILIELAAQTAGVCNGWDRIQTKGLDSDQMGWLVGIKKADFFVAGLPVGTSVIVRAENTYSFENLRQVSCELHHNDTLIGSATLQLFQA